MHVLKDLLSACISNFVSTREWYVFLAFNATFMHTKRRFSMPLVCNFAKTSTGDLSYKKSLPL